MAEKIINNPSLLPSDLAFELSGNTITAISGHPIAGSGGGTVSDLVYYPVFDNSNGNVTFHLGTSAHGPEPGGAWHISGADGVDGISPKVQINPETNEWEVSEDGGETWDSTGVEATGPQGEQGIQGIQGIPGVDGKNPVFEIDSNNAHWKWKYAEATSGWTDLGIVASGAVGPKGDDGANGTDGKDGKDGKDGTDGVSPTVSTSVIEGGNRVTFTYGAGSSTYIDVMSGTPGAKGADGTNGTNGKDGVSPTVSSEQVTGGTEVTFTYGTGQTETITVLNGIDGASGASGASGYSPTITLEPATSASYPNGGTKVTITDLEHQAGQEFYVWNGNDGQGATVNLLEGTGIKIDRVGQDYTIGVSGDYASTSDVEAASANAYDKAVAQIPDVTNFITKDVNNLTYYYNKTETSSTSEISNALSTKLDSTVAEQTYQTKAGMTNYLTTSDASTTYQPKGNYASASDITDMATKTWVGQRGYLTQSDLDDYATETYVETASANAYDKAVAQIPNVDNFITKDVNDLTYYYKKTETSGSTELSTEFAKKVNNPDTSLTDKYLVLRTDTNGAASGWCDFNDKIYSKTESDGRYMQNITDSSLSGNGTSNNPLGIDTTNMAASKQYAFTTTGWAEVSVPTIPDITANNGLSATGHTVGISTTNIDANKQYAWTTTGWQLVSVPTIPDITAHNGLSADGHTVGIDDTNIAANTQYAWTTNGWNEIVGYLPTSGGTVSGQLVVSGGSTFDQQFLKITRENVNGYGRIGLGSSGPLAFKVDDASSHTTQINISPNTTNDQLVQVQHNSNTVGYLIPAQIHQGSYTPSENDGILHIVLESE